MNTASKVQNVVLSGVAVVDVPIVNPLSKTELTEKQKKERKEAKRAIFRERKRMYDRHMSEQESRKASLIGRMGMTHDDYHCRCINGITGRTGHSQMRAGESVELVAPYTTDGAGYHAKVKVGVVAIPGDNYRQAYVPMPTHQFRRKVSSGETPEQFVQRLERTVGTFWTMGFSFVDKACHCPACLTYRKNAYGQWLSLNPKAYTEARMLEWDAEQNPFADNYRYKQTRTIRRDEDGNPVPRRPGGPTRWPGAGIGGDTFSDPKARGGAARLVGLEIEHNRDVPGSAQWVHRWNGAQVIGDGSCGREAVTPPLAGENIRKCVEDICNTLNKENAGCDSRCGLHVHVDARDMRWADMLRFLTVYCRIESLLFLIGGQNRYSKPSDVGGGYCFPVAELYGKALKSSDPKGAILAAACIGDRPAVDGRNMMKDNPPGKKGHGRYKSINILPWIAGRAFQRKDTTVEFRLHRGSHNAERVIHWAQLCQDIVDWCIKASNDDVAKLPKSAARILMTLSPRSKDWVIRRILGWRAATTAGKAPIEDDVGNYKPRRIVSMKNGLYLIDPNRCSYRRG